MGDLPNRSSRKTMMMKSLIFVALVAAAAQASVQETEFVQEGSEMDSFSAAQSRVESMLEMDTRARRSACVKAADASINNVFKEVQNAQRSLNRLDNGRRCASRNQHLINRAQHTIREVALGRGRVRWLSCCAWLRFGVSRLRKSVKNLILWLRTLSRRRSESQLQEVEQKTKRKPTARTLIGKDSMLRAQAGLLNAKLK